MRAPHALARSVALIQSGRLAWRYALAAVGPIGSAGAQFLLNLVLLARLDASAYGRFTFLFIVAQFGASIWSALFCAPLPALLAGLSNADRTAIVRGVAFANAAGALVAGVALLVIAYAAGEPHWAALTFAFYATASLLRWFARALAYAVGQQLRATASDLLYTVLLLGGTLWLALHPQLTTARGYEALGLSMLIGLLPFLGMLPKHAPGTHEERGFHHYRAMWRQHGRWSLLGVVSTEATVNAHTYLVTTALGTAAFAPLAASTLAVRPAFVVNNALMEFERARFAQLALEPTKRPLRAGLRHFRHMLIAAWIANGAAVGVLLATKPTLLFPPRYDLGTILLGVALWMVIALVRLARTPENTLVQSLGLFRVLAITTCWSSLVALVATALLVLVAPPIWSVGGVLLGEIVVTWLVLAAARRAMRQRVGIGVSPE